VSHPRDGRSQSLQTLLSFHANLGDFPSTQTQTPPVAVINADQLATDFRVLICTSPKAGSGAGRNNIARLVQALQSHHMSVEVTTNINRVRECAGFGMTDAELTHFTAPVIVTAGGDGTLALVAQNTPPSTVLLPMPLGTENLLAKHFGFTANPNDIVETLLHGIDQPIDAGIANGKLFLVMATCGFDAEVVRAMHLTRRGHINRFSYTRPILRTLRRYRFPPLSVTLLSEHPDDASKSCDLRACALQAEQLLTCRWAMVFNLPKYAASLPIETAAICDDGQLDFTGLTAGSIASGLRYLGGILSGRHIHWPDVTRKQITGCRITSPMRVPFQLDGDYAGRLPLDIRVLPNYIKLRLPTTCPLERT
jgi:diacylglycerol kinase (ATP)